MHPILFQFPDWIPLIGGKGIHTYGALVALGFLMGLSFIKRQSSKSGLDAQKTADLFFYILVAALLGSRILYVLASVPQWWNDPLVFIRFWEGGLVFYGGLIAAVLVSIWYCRKHQLAFLTVADVFTPAIAIGHAIGRLGCLSAGCCYGKEAPFFPFAIIFPHDPLCIAPQGIPLYPTQIFEALAESAIFLFLIWFQRRKKFEGEIFLLYIIIYPLFRSVMEIFRGDQVRGFVVDGLLSTSQFISIIWVAIALVVWVGILRRQKNGKN